MIVQGHNLVITYLLERPAPFHLEQREVNLDWDALGNSGLLDPKTGRLVFRKSNISTVNRYRHTMGDRRMLLDIYYSFVRHVHFPPK